MSLEVCTFFLMYEIVFNLTFIIMSVYLNVLQMKRITSAISIRGMIQNVSRSVFRQA